MRAARNGSFRLLAIAAIGVALVGCRLAGSGSTSVSSLPPSASASVGEVAADPSPSPSGPEAPEDCGFPPGTALEFAGRSTYAALGVGDARGASSDPMSDVPADIYITRGTLDEPGHLNGRMVCAIFVRENPFVEITMHPDDMGKYTPVPEPAPVPEPGQPANGLSADAAIEAARAALPVGNEWSIELVPDSGAIADFFPDYQNYEWGRELTADHWVWTLSARRENQAIRMVIDFVDGTVVGTVEYTLDDCGRFPSDPEYGMEECPDL